MGVFRKLKSLFPIPTAWQQVDEKKKFCLRAEEAYRWLQMELGNVEEEKAGSIELLSTDNTWDKIWAKVNTMEINKTYTLFCHGTPADILSSGVRTNSLAGTITRVQDGIFLITVRMGQAANGFATAYWDGVSGASRGTYTENNIYGKVTSLQTDVDNRVVGKQQMKSIPGSTNSCRIDFENGVCCFLILSMPGNRTWIGYVYTGGDGTCSAIQINSATNMTVTGNTNYITVTFNYTSTGNFFMTAIPFRGSGVPSFH